MVALHMWQDGLRVAPSGAGWLWHLKGACIARLSHHLFYMVLTTALCADAKHRSKIECMKLIFLEFLQGEA